MFRNRMSQLVQHLPDPSIIGSKLRDSLIADNLTDVTEDTPYSKAAEKVRRLRETTLQLEKSGREYFKTTRPDKQKMIHDQINAKITEGNNLMKELKPMIDQINKDFKSESEQGDRSGIVDCNRITQQTSDALKGFKEAQENISEEIKSTIQRQAYLIQGEEISQKELEDLVLHPEKGQEMLKEKLLDAPSVQLENSVSDIIDKCNDVLKLEKSMRECLGMMEQLALLVQLQGEKLLTIESAIDGAHDHVNKGDVKLQKGKEYHKKSKKKMCCVMMLVLVIIGIIVIPIIITQMK